MDTQFDNESYWNSSSVAFNFDDDVIDVGSSKGLDSISSVFFDDDSEFSFEHAAPVGIDLSIGNIINDETLKIILQEQTLDDRVIMKGMSPEKELKLLRRQIQTTLYSPTPEATAQKLLLGKNTSLDIFKSLEEKRQLLDTLLSRGGGDSVISILLFLKRTLNKQHFLSILFQNQKALKHYISYLKHCEKTDELIALLEENDRIPEASLLRLKLAADKTDAQSRKNYLATLNTDNLGFAGLYQQLFVANLKLHELIVKEPTLVKNYSYPTPIEVLYYCCQRSNNWKENDIMQVLAPLRLCAEQHISGVQYEWTAMNERACSEAYGDLECIFERVQAWNPMKTKQFHISFSLHLAILRLHELKVPPSVIYQFFTKMANTTEKLELAQRVKCSKAIIDALAALKQTNELLQLKDTLPERSEERFYCENLLKTLQSKRWTTDNIKLML